MIVLDRVAKRYGSHVAVDTVSFEVARGETLVLLGRSGCGKTTTLKMINRLVEPTSGKIHVFGEAVLEQPKEQLRRKIGYVIQAVGLFPHYTVEENVAVVPKLLGWDRARIAARVEELLALVGLPVGRFAAVRPSALSGGQQQRVGLARALAGDPPVVLLDEPFGALDPVTRRELQTEFVALSARLDKTMVLVTHDVAEAISVGHRICLLEAGRVEQIGTARELLFHPATDFVRTFFDPGRLNLELLASTLRDLLPHLELGPEAEGRAARIPVATRILDVLERPDVAAGLPCHVVGDDGVVSGTTNPPAILEAFYAFRAKESAR